MEQLRNGATRALVAVRDRIGNRSEKGAGLVEYALLVALIALICIAAITFVGTSTCSNINDTRLSAIGGGGAQQPDC